MSKLNPNLFLCAKNDSTIPKKLRNSDLKHYITSNKDPQSMTDDEQYLKPNQTKLN